VVGFAYFVVVRWTLRLLSLLRVAMSLVPLGLASPDILDDILKPAQIMPNIVLFFPC
jgi:hypothetical protein